MNNEKKEQPENRPITRAPIAHTPEHETQAPRVKIPDPDPRLQMTLKESLNPDRVKTPSSDKRLTKEIFLNQQEVEKKKKSVD